MEISEKLKELGLNEYEAKIYLALVRTGKSGSGKIAAKSGVPYGRVYDILESLVKKGLVVIAPEKPKKYYAASPSIIEKMLEEKIKGLEEFKTEIKVLSKRYEAFPEETIFVTKGKENFHRLVAQAPEAEKTDYSVKWDFKFHPMWVKKDRTIIKKGVDMRVMGPINERTKENLKQWIKFEKIKEFPNDGCPLWIVDDKFVLIGLINSDATVMIKDRAFVELMRNMFEEAWKNRKEIKEKDLK